MDFHPPMSLGLGTGIMDWRETFCENFFQGIDKVKKLDYNLIRQ